LVQLTFARRHASNVDFISVSTVEEHGAFRYGTGRPIIELKVAQKAMEISDVKFEAYALASEQLGQA
jgi:hypothetical protein